MSNSVLVQQRFSACHKTRRFVAYLYIAATLVYLCWRATIINGDAPLLSVIYLSAETLGFVLGLTLIFSSWNYRHRTPRPPEKDLNVDVFVTTYREPADLVRFTLIAAKEITYPHRTVLLDDGNRLQMRALAAELGIRYLARGHNTHAKAGNLNFGLAHSDADFVMVLDADHIALPHALHALLGFFGDERVAMAQCPQDYYNVDAFQFVNASKRGLLWHDQSFFYQIAQSCRDWFNGASCVGTSVVYRRSALDAIGGVPTATVTEDIHTSLKLHKAGYEVVYLNESVAYGVAAADIRDYYKTRHRWAHGNIRALCVEKILTCPGLTLGQRLSYLTLGLIYIEGWQQMLLFMVPWASLLFGWAPFDITFFNVVVVLLFPVFTSLLLQELGCGLSRYWVNEIFSAAQFPVHLVASLALFSNSQHFRTSEKNTRGRVDWRLLSPQIAVGTLSLVALAFGTIHFLQNPQVGPLANAIADLSSGNLAQIDWNARLDQGYTLELVMVAGFWALYNAAKCFYVVRKAVIDARLSSDDYRFALELPVKLRSPGGSWRGCVETISRTWVSMRLYGEGAPALGARLSGDLHLPSGIVPIECVVTERSVPKTTRLTIAGQTIEIAPPAGATSQIACDLMWRKPGLRDRLARSLYSIDWHREYLHRHAFFVTPLTALWRCLRMRPPAGDVPTTWSPALYGFGQTDRHFAVVDWKPDEEVATIIVFRNLPARAALEIEILRHDGIEKRLLQVVGPVAENTPGSRGLDGARFWKYRALVMPAAGVERISPVLVAAE